MATRAPRSTPVMNLVTAVVASITAATFVVTSAALTSPSSAASAHHAWAKPGAHAFLGVVPRRGAAVTGIHHHIGNATNPACSGCKPPLLFTPDVPVLGGASGTPGVVTVTPIFWHPTGVDSAFPSGYATVISQYLSDVAAASGSTTNVFGVGTQYFQAQSGTSAQMI